MFVRENLIKFLNIIYLLIYARLIVHTILNLAYPKEHAFCQRISKLKTIDSIYFIFFIYFIF